MALQHIEPEGFKAIPTGGVPPFLEPLLVAAKTGGDITALVMQLTESFGFNTCTFIASMANPPKTETRNWIYTTMPRAWTKLYMERDYVEVDPRLFSVNESYAPAIWDQTSYRGRSTVCDEFLDTAESFGISSGVLFPLRSTMAKHVVFGLNSDIPVNSPERLAVIRQRLGDINLFGQYFSELFLSGVIARKVASPLEGAALSKREREVLNLLTQGHSGKALAHLLKIAPGTVQLHLDSIRSKLGATSREEAVAIAIKQGIV